MSCGKPNSNCCPSNVPACCPPIVIRRPAQNQKGQTVMFQLPPVNIVCEIPPPPKNQTPPKVCYVPIVVCEDDGDSRAQGCQAPRNNGRGCPF